MKGGWNLVGRRIALKGLHCDFYSRLNNIFKDPKFRERWEALGTPVVGGTAAQFGELIKKESVRLGKVVKDAGVTVD